MNAHNPPPVSAADVQAAIDDAYGLQKFKPDQVDQVAREAVETARDWRGAFQIFNGRFAP